jgi:hypothetical protein
MASTPLLLHFWHALAMDSSLSELVSLVELQAEEGFRLAPIVCLVALGTQKASFWRQPDPQP